MLLPDNIHPENSIFYNGTFVLQELQKGDEIDLLNLYQKVKQYRDMNFSIFVLCIDWLFLIDVLRLNHNGKVKLCS